MTGAGTAGEYPPIRVELECVRDGVDAPVRFEVTCVRAEGNVRADQGGVGACEVCVDVCGGRKAERPGAGRGL